jgi:hypothetical protein
VTGTVSCWGSNGKGELGGAGRSSSSNPVAVKGVANAVAVSAGDHFACALLASGNVECWGDNGSGELGDGPTAGGAAAQVNGVHDAIAISAGSRHVCAVSDGDVLCWGDNSYGQLGTARRRPGRSRARQSGRRTRSPSPRAGDTHARCSRTEARNAGAETRSGRSAGAAPSTHSCRRLSSGSDHSRRTACAPTASIHYRS